MTDAALRAWLVTTPARGPSRRGSVVCFPHAGGGPIAFAAWPSMLPDHDVHVVHLPGRESRLDETPVRDLDAVSDRVAEAIADRCEHPAVLFGHSFGALLAYEVGRRLAAVGAPPAHLVAAGSRSPHRHPGRRIDRLPDREFVDHVAAIGGTPAELLDANVMDVFLPALRADFAMACTYHDERATPLPCGIAAFGGNRDERLPVEQMRSWRRYADGSFTTRTFDGGHFFVRTSRVAVVAAVEQIATSAALELS